MLPKIRNYAELYNYDGDKVEVRDIVLARDKQWAQWILEQLTDVHCDVCSGLINPKDILISGADFEALKNLAGETKTGDAK